MKKFKKMMLGLVLAVTLLGNCLSVAAPDHVTVPTCTICDAPMTLYEKQYTGITEYWKTHTEQHGAITVVCDIYKKYFNARYICSNHSTPVIKSASGFEEVHVY